MFSVCDKMFSVCDQMLSVCDHTCSRARAFILLFPSISFVKTRNPCREEGREPRPDGGRDGVGKEGGGRGEGGREGGRD